MCLFKFTGTYFMHTIICCILTFNSTTDHQWKYSHKLWPIDYMAISVCASTLHIFTMMKSTNKSFLRMYPSQKATLFLFVFISNIFSSNLKAMLCFWETFFRRYFYVEATSFLSEVPGWFLHNPELRMIFIFLKVVNKLGTVAHTCNPSSPSSSEDWDRRIEFKASLRKSKVLSNWDPDSK